MPFERLQTDEQVEGPPPKKTDFEASLMQGCSVIGIASVITYGLAVWPWLVFPEHRVQGLMTILLTGALPASVFGVVVILRFGIAGASGFFGGSLAAAVFMYLRLTQTMLAKLNINLPTPEYPERWSWMLPLAWCLWAAMLSILLLPGQQRGRPDDKDGT